MSKNKLSIIIIVIAVVAAATLFVSNKSAPREQAAKAPAAQSVNTLVEPAAKGEETTELTVTARNGKFSPASLSAPVGSRVLLTFVNLDGDYRGWGITGKYLQTATPTIAPNEQATISFSPSKAETITFYDPAHPNDAGFKGTLVIQ